MKIILPLIIAISLCLQGCASFGKGVADAIIHKSPSENKGECRVLSEGFKGINEIFNKKGNIRVIMVHGIGNRVPGYSTNLHNALAYKLDLNEKTKKYKDIILKSSNVPGEDIGHLRVFKMSKTDGSKEMIFYEFTWASVTAPLKASLDFDSNASRRTELAKIGKKFVNEKGTDALIYLGNDNVNKRIKAGMMQSLCWMMVENWDNLPESESYECTEKNIAIVSSDKNPVIITHSLGSQIAIDTLQSMASYDEDETADRSFVPESFKEYARNLESNVFMFANQLPAIALGKTAPKVSNSINDYCIEGAKFYNKRYLKKLNIIAFSDPNDILSYSIPAGFEDLALDSRLCPSVTNVLVNVAPIANILGVKMANPFSAHSNYQNDDRVLDLIINGTEAADLSTNPDKGCYWIKLID